MKNLQWFAGLLNDNSYFNTEAEAAWHCLQMAISMAYDPKTVELWRGEQYINGACFDEQHTNQTTNQKGERQNEKLRNKNCTAQPPRNALREGPDELECSRRLGPILGDLPTL